MYLVWRPRISSCGNSWQRSKDMFMASLAGRGLNLRFCHERDESHNVQDEYSFLQTSHVCYITAFIVVLH